jgi:hypothetical protein
MRIDEYRSSLELFLQKTSLKENFAEIKVENQNAKREAPTPQVVM